MLIGRATFRRLVQAREMIADDDRSVRAIADAVGLSPYHFIRQFAAVYGATPHQLRVALRLARAREMLGHGASVTEVCHAVGYTSVGSFSALFTRWTGTNPARYRAQIAVPRAVEAIVPGCFGLLAMLPANAQFPRSIAARA